jgi:hypothetical protein
MSASPVEWTGKIIALDIGRVCISLHFDRCFEAFGMKPGDELSPDFLMLCRELAVGAIEEGPWIEKVRRMRGNGMSAEQVRDAWNLMLGPSFRV